MLYLNFISQTLKGIGEVAIGVQGIKRIRKWHNKKEKRKVKNHKKKMKQRKKRQARKKKQARRRSIPRLWF